MTPGERAATGEGGNPQTWRSLRALLPFLWPAGMRWRVILALAFLVLGQVGNVAWPLLFRDAVDALSPKDAAQAALSVPVWLILGFGLVRIGGTLGQQLRAAVFARVAQRAIRRVAAQVFDHLTQLGLSFHLNRRTGGLTRALDRGSRAIDQLLSVVLFNLAPTLLEIVFVCGVLWVTLGWLYAFLTLLTVGLYIAFTMAVTEWRLKFRRQMNDMDSRAGAIAVDSLLNIETVKAFANEALESQRYDRALASYEESAVRTDVSLALLNIGQGAILSVGMAGIMLIAGFGVVAGSITVGSFAMVTTYLLQLTRPMNLFGTVYRQVKQSLTDMETLFALLDEPIGVKDRPDARPLAVTDGAVSFTGVAFAYSPDRPVLRGIDLAIPAGHTAAVVGATGAGKSTLTRLLLRFYDPTAGTIRIDGQDIAAVTQASLRRQIGVVPQDTVLFNDSIAYNIAYGHPEASRAEIARAAELAQLDGFIADLPQDYDTLVGERGLKLSGGEKQRVAIARAILKDPPILIFDEATSSLDSATERAIQASLDRVSRGRTTLTIAHRLSTVSGADQIAVMDRGAIVERGTHSALLAAGGAYAQLWQRQQHEAESA